MRLGLFAHLAGRSLSLEPPRSPQKRGVYFAAVVRWSGRSRQELFWEDRSRCEAFKACFEQLDGLTNKELDLSVVKLAAVENRNVARVIAHLAEISRRKAELEHGYRSLFDYGVRRLGLSEGSVALRIQVANVARRFPGILAALAEGRISLSVAGRLAPHLREDNVEALLADCAGMTRRAVEEYLVQLRPRPIFEPSIRTLSDAQVSTAPELPSQPAPRPSQPPATVASGLLAPATPEFFNFRFAADKEFKLKLERLAEVLGIENPAKNMAEILEKALGLALEAKDPERRLERRLARKRRQEDAALKSQSANCESRPGEIASREPATSRHVQAKIVMRRLQAHGPEPEGVPDGELLGELEAKRGEVGCCDSGNIHC